MRERLSKNIIGEKKTGRIDEACFRYGVGRNSMRDIASKAEAVIKIGGTYLINFTKVDDYMDSISEK